MKDQHTFVPTAEQLAACTRHTDSNSKPYYTAQSATDPDSTYYVRWKPGHAWPSCSCKDGGYSCWHAKVAMLQEKAYQDAVQSGQIEANIREQKATKRDGDRAYTRKPFNLLAS